MPRSYIDASRSFEGFDPTAKWDYKQWTNGFGTRALYPGESIDRTEAERRYQNEYGKANDFVKGLNLPDLTPGREGALTDLTHTAVKGWPNEGLGQAARAGDWNSAKNIFTQYNRAGGRVNPTLVNRRGSTVGWFDDPSDGTSVGTAMAPQYADNTSLPGRMSLGGPPPAGQSAMPNYLPTSAPAVDPYTGMTPEQVATYRQRGQKLYDEGTAQGPVAGGIGAIAKALTGAFGGYYSGQANEGEAAGRRDANMRLVQALTNKASPEDTATTLMGNPYSSDAGQQMAVDALKQNQAIQQRASQAKAAGLEAGTPDWKKYMLTGQLPNPKDRYIATQPGGGVFDVDAGKPVDQGDPIQEYLNTRDGGQPGQQPAPQMTPSSAPQQPGQPSVQPTSGPQPALYNGQTQQYGNGPPGIPTPGGPTAVTGPPAPSMNTTPYALATPDDVAMARLETKNPRAAAALRQSPGYQQRVTEAQAVGKDLGALQERQRAGRDAVMPVFQQLKAKINGLKDAEFQAATGPYNMSQFGPYTPFVAGMTPPEAAAAYPKTYGLLHDSSGYDNQNSLKHDVEGLVTAFVNAAAKSGIQMSDKRQENFEKTMGLMLKSSNKDHANEILDEAQNIIQSTFGLGATTSADIQGKGQQAALPDPLGIR